MAQTGALTLAEIEFDPRVTITSHPRYRDFAPLIGSDRFDDYREVFERGFAETSIMRGELLRLDYLPVARPNGGVSPQERVLGSYPHWRRIGLAVELLGEYERLGHSGFASQVLATGYAEALRVQFMDSLKARGLLATLRGRWRVSARVRHRSDQLITLYENMKRFESLVGDARVPHQEFVPLGATDVPWAIDYPGYLRLREGSHRRAAAISLGWETIPTLVFEFGRVQSEDLAIAHPYLAERFEWFRERVVHGS